MMQEQFFYIMKKDSFAPQCQWWKPNASGYTDDLNEAGKYDHKFIVNRYDKDKMVIVPCEVVDEMYFPKVLPWTGENLKHLADNSYKGE